jgi:imidazole glycerol-phosphate synthase subunit HisH
MKVTIIDYGSGNLRSVAKSFERVASANTTICVSSDIGDIETASHIVLPGVGAFADCMSGINATSGLRESLQKNVHEYKKPFLGICVGMQLLADKGFEHGSHSGLGWIAGDVVPITGSGLKIPHMGWNTLSLEQPHPVLAHISSGDHAYFVHSYHFTCAENRNILAYTDYGSPIAAIIGQDNIIATQFHPEKSQVTGLTLLHNFLAWRP